jgi:hypothetical protein
MQTRTIANYFNSVPLFSWSNGTWLDLRNKGAVSNFYGGMDAVSVDAGERRLVTDLPLPMSCAVVRLGRTGASPYAVGYRPDVVHSSSENEPFSYILHRVHDVTEVWRGVKTISAAGTASSVTWTKVQTTFSNPCYTDSNNNPIFKDTVFIGYSLVLPSDCIANVDDELRLKDGIYVIRSIHDLNDIRVALSHRKELPA